MALTRDWRPSPNYTSSSGTSGKRLLVIHTTEGFTGSNGMYDLAAYFGGNVGASSDVGIDAFHPGRIVEMVSPYNNAWTQCNYNSATAAAVEQCAYASWSRDTWLGPKEPLLRNTAQWLAEESKRFGIPLVSLNDSQSQGSGRGVTYHSRLGSAGCGHSDPGSGYPLDVVLDWANQYAGGTPPEPVIPEDDVISDEQMNEIVTRTAAECQKLVWTKIYNSYVFTNPDGSRCAEATSVPLYNAEKYAYLTWKGLTDAGAIRAADPSADEG